MVPAPIWGIPFYAVIGSVTGVVLVIIIGVAIGVHIRHKKSDQLKEDVENALVEQETLRVQQITNLMKQVMANAQKRQQQPPGMGYQTAPQAYGYPPGYPGGYPMQQVSAGPTTFWAYEPVPGAGYASYDEGQAAIMQTPQGGVEAYAMPQMPQYQHYQQYQQQQPQMMLPAQYFPQTPQQTGAMRMRKATDFEVPPGAAPPAPPGYVTVPMVIEPR
ncbi:MAG: hypothetical protein KVP17_004035 [Porospora cf. gigantea B]|uniref:uncharacterized protein n=1 Tax=Porospora cf. gigantea B TaxID=2853592 RepID=UPI003571E082|nr:MAG: hypothetical protein KVP17_004035 [Porospora cf. gigantea B]